MVNINFKNTTTSSGTNFVFYETYINLNFSTLTEEVTYNFDFGYVVSIVYILRNTNLNSIWCDNSASLNSGRFYVGSTKDLTTINHNNGQAFIEDYYSKNTAGRSTETLEEETSVDITVSY
jgi:hypothetical protein